ELADRIREHQPKDIDFIQALNGDLVMCYQGLPLHSLDNPVDEAQKVFDNVKNTKYNTFNIVYGLGLGYLFKRATMETEGTIVVFEPHLDVLKTTLEVVDFVEEIQRKNTFVINELKDLRRIFGHYFYKGDDVCIQMLTSYRIAYPEILSELTTLLQESYRTSIINQQTMLYKTRQWSVAALNNLFDILESPDSWGLKDRFKDVPAVLVSAGPSLEFAIDTLRKYQDKVMIIAVGQALKALDKAGIRPHIVEVIENLNVSQQFDGVSCLDQLTVALQPMTHRAIYELPVKRLLLNFPNSDNIARWFGDIMKRQLRGFPNRGSVSFCAYYNAFHFGNEPMILVGQDLAYRDGKCYASGTSYDKIKYELDEEGKVKINYNEELYETIGKTFEMNREEFMSRKESQEKEIMKVKGWSGEDLHTTVTYNVFLNNYIDIAETELERYEKVLINCSIGGAYIKGIEHMSLQECLENRCNLNHGINIDQALDDYYEEFKIAEEDYKRFVRGIRKTEDDLNDAKKIAQYSINLSNSILKELSKKVINEKYVDGLVDKLGKNDRKVINVVKKTRLINPFINKELYEYSKGYSREAENIDPENKIENLKDNVEQSLKLYEAIINGAESINEILPAIIEKNKERLEQYIDLQKVK
ncbi:MAG: 6-hydroxymethylpterin diphosphokinase MptE-like protein, partial [Cyanobacteriota bacterium]